MVLGVNARVSVPKKPFNGKDTLQQDEIERIKKADKNDGIQSALKVRDRRLMLSNLGLF